MIKILLVDDHDMVRGGLRTLLAEIKDCEVIAEANSGEQAVELAKKLAVDLILMDILMPGIGGLEATRRLLQIKPDAKVIVLSACTNKPYLYHFVHAGAKGYLTKGCSFDELLKAIHKVSSGGRYFESKFGNLLTLQTIHEDQERASPFAALSVREMQVVLMLLNSYSITGIAEELDLSKKTISTYRHRLLQKLEIKSNIELIRLAVQHNVLSEI